MSTPYREGGWYYVFHANQAGGFEAAAGGIPRGLYGEAHRPSLFNRLLLTGKLYEHLAEVDEQANEQLEQMIPKMALAEGVTEELKARDPIRWVGLMNNLKACAEESILSDLVYD